jgi:two-component system response regulator
MRSNLSILLAEDDETDVALLQRAFREADVPNPLHVARNGREAVEFLSATKDVATARLPALVILDIKMPHLSGLEALRWIREQPVVRRIPVFIFSSSALPSDIENAYEYGANGYFVKPAGTMERRELARLFLEWLQKNEPPMAAKEPFRKAAAFRLGGGNGRRNSPAR